MSTPSSASGVGPALPVKPPKPTSPFFTSKTAPAAQLMQQQQQNIQQANASVGSASPRHTTPTPLVPPVNGSSSSATPGHHHHTSSSAAAAAATVPSHHHHTSSSSSYSSLSPRHSNSPPPSRPLPEIPSSMQQRSGSTPSPLPQLPPQQPPTPNQMNPASPRGLSASVTASPTAPSPLMSANSFPSSNSSAQPLPLLEECAFHEDDDDVPTVRIHTGFPTMNPDTFARDLQAARAAAAAAARRPSITIPAVETAAEVPPVTVQVTPGDDMSPTPPRGQHSHSQSGYTTYASDSTGMFSPTRPSNTPMAASNELNIFSPTRPVMTPAAKMSLGGGIGAGVTPNRPAHRPSAGQIQGHANTMPPPSLTSYSSSSSNGAPKTSISSAASTTGGDSSSQPYSRRLSLLAKTHLTFKSSLRHQFPLIESQVSAGQASIKRTSTFLKKISEQLSDHSSNMMKLTSAEEVKAETARHTDSMQDHHKALCGITSALDAIARRDSVFAEKILATVVKPMLNWLPTAEEKRNRIVKEEKTQSTKLADGNKECEKLRTACLKLWAELNQLKKDREHEKTLPGSQGKPTEKTLKKLSKQRETVRKEFLKYEQMKESITQKNVDWRNTILPNLLNHMEDLERDRLGLVKKISEAFVNTMRDCVGAEPQPISILPSVEQAIAELHPGVDVARYIESCTLSHGLPPPDVTHLQDLPCLAADLDSDRWETAGETRPQRDSLMLGQQPPHSPLSPFVVNGNHARGQSLSSSQNGADREERLDRMSEPGSSPTSSSGLGLSIDSRLALTPLAASAPTPSHAGGSSAPHHHGHAGSVSMSQAPIGSPGGGDGDEDDEEEDDNNLAAAAQQISEEWYVALIDHPSPSAAASSGSTSPSASSSALSSAISDLPLLKFNIDDIIRVTDRSGGDTWVGSLVGEIGGQLRPGRFPKYLVRSIDDKYIEPTIKPGSSESGSMADMIRGKVSKKKRRFQQDGFDLDLTYILPNIIAMGFPSEGLEGTYRNKLTDVQRFFKTRHNGEYKLYNLCSERWYDSSKFEGRVSRYPFDDHNPCNFALIQPIMEDIHKHLHPNGVFSPNRVAAIHCKAGKGRTGFIIASWLLYSTLFPSYQAELALKYYGVKRTKNGKGVTIPSQIRYVYYFARYLRQERGITRFPIIPIRNPVLLQTIRLMGIPKASTNKDIWFKLITGDSKYNSKGRITPSRRVAEDYVVFQGSGGSSTGIASLDQDVHLTFFVGGFLDTTKLFQCWFNTRMIGIMEQQETQIEVQVRHNSTDHSSNNGDDDDQRVLTLTKAELDKACKDVAHKNYVETFRVEFVFSSA